jgi:hypothetical protein
MIPTIKFKIFCALAAIALWTSPIFAQGIPGQFMVPLGQCQLSASQLGSSVGLGACIRASFTGSATGAVLTVSSVSGIIKVGDFVAGTGVPASTTITAQLSGTIGGAGTYSTSQATTASSASLTSGGIPVGATMAVIQAETANVRYRDDGASPTSSIGLEIVSGASPILYTGTLSALQFIAASGSPVLDVAFYR